MPKLIYIFLAVELIIVAFFDVTKKKIYNIWSIINILAFTVALYYYPNFYVFKVEALVFSFVFIIVGMFLYALKIMGPGDSKFLSSMFLLIPASIQESYFYCLCVITIFVGSSLLITNIFENKDKVVYFFKTGDFLPLKKKMGKKFPFAPLIFLSWVWFGWRSYKLWV